MKLKPYYIIEVETDIKRYLPRFSYAGRYTKHIESALPVESLAEAERLAKKHDGKIIKIKRKGEYID